MAMIYRARNGRRIDVDLGEIKGEFAAYCRRAGVTESEAVRRMVGRVLGAETGRLPRADLDEDETGGMVSSHVRSLGARRRVELKLTEREYALLDSTARRAGFPVNRWIVAMIRAQATMSPQFGEGELAALVESNYQMAAIGRNLNQLARALNAAPEQSVERHRLTVIDAMKRAIDAHLNTVHGVMRANLERWRR